MEGQWPRQRLVGMQNAAHHLDGSKSTRFLARMIELGIRLIFSAAIPAKAKIHRSVHFGHSALGVVLNELCVIDEHAFIGHHVTLGGKSPILGAPHIEPYVTIHAGATVIGPITIGRGAVIGANAVVTRDIPPFSVAAGVPARILRTVAHTPATDETASVTSCRSCG